MSHKWHFFRAGGVDQVSLRTGADLLALPELDQKLWMALAMPGDGVDIDRRTLDLLDHDGDGRVRAADILAAVAWIGATWKSADDVLAGGDSLPLGAIKDPAVLAAARRVLADLGEPDATRISLAQVGEVVAAFSATVLNGDGVIIAASAGDPDLRQAVDEIAAGAGTVADRSGKPGIDQAAIDRFFADVDQLAAWQDAGLEVQPLGEATAAAADALVAVRAKIDDFFARTRLVGFDPRAAAAVNGQDADFTALAGKLLTSSCDDIARLPLARVEAGAALPLRGPVNPAWADALARFAEQAVTPVVGARETLTAEEWHRVDQALAGFVAWRQQRPTTCADRLAPERVAALSSGGHRQALAELVAADRALEGEYAAFESVEKLLRLQRDFGRVVRNFVNFSDFYSRRDGAFQAGTLYLDGRAFRLTVAVGDAGKHATLGAMSSSYLAYCDIQRAGVKKQIAVAVTNGDGDNIFVGRNGVFYDRAGKDWDATVTRIVSNPISVRQAFWTPYKKLVRLVEEQVGKRASEAESKAGTRVERAATKVATVDHHPAPAAPAAAAPAAAAAAAPRKGLDVGIIAVISLAIGAVVGALGGLVAMLVGLGAWMPVGVVALLLAISGPSMVLAWMKLRQRNLGPLLDANGWAINTRARVNVALGAALTHLGAVPRGSSRSLDDPFADRRRPWWLYITLVVLLVLAATWYAGKLDRYLPHAVESGQVLGKHAPVNKR